MARMARVDAAAMYESSGPYIPFELLFPGAGAPSVPPAAMSVGAVGRMRVLVGDDEELVELRVELFDVVLPVG